MATPTLNPKITAAGIALFPNGDLNGFQLELTHIAIGTGQYEPVLNADGRATQTALVAEVARYKITSGADPTPTSVQIGTTITDTDDTGRSPNGKFISEIGFYAGNTLFAVWSRTGDPLFYKSASFPVPFAYTMDVSILPDNAVTIVLNTDTTGMAALILAHEAKADPHSQYYQKTGGVIGKQNTGWPALNAPTSRVVDDGAGSTGGLSIESYTPMLTFQDRTAGAKNSRWRYDNGVYDVQVDTAGDGAYGAAPLLRLSVDKSVPNWFRVPTFFNRTADDTSGAYVQVNGGVSALQYYAGTVVSAARTIVSSDGIQGYLWGEKALVVGTQTANPLQLLTNNVERARLLATGELLVGAAALDGTAAKLQVTGYASFDTPPAGDSSRRGATTEFVSRLVRTNEIGAIRIEIRTSVRAGYLKLNGALVNRADYPELWAYAQASGALVTEAQWTAGSWGCFSIGDGANTFRLPEWRGEGLRFLDDGRGIDVNRAIGTYQAGQNESHNHAGSSDTVAGHAHSAWTDAQGYHGHGVNDPGHAHSYDVPPPATDWDGQGASSGNSWLDLTKYSTRGTYGAGTGIWLSGDGSHGHNIGMSAAGAHAHAISVGFQGGNEARMRNISALAMIRAF